MLLSRHWGLRRGLGLNINDGERSDDGFGEVLAMVSLISLQCFCFVGEILWKSFVVYEDTTQGAETGFGVGTLGSLKFGGCCDWSE